MTHHCCTVDSSMNMPIDNESKSAMRTWVRDIRIRDTRPPRKGGGGHLPDNYAIRITSALVIDPLL